MNWFTVLGPFAATLAFIAVLRRSPLAARMADVPNERSLHVDVTPRIGGLAMMLAALPLVWLDGASDLRVAALAAAALAAVSLADDLSSLPIAVRLPCHVAAAIAAVWVGAGPALLASAAGLALALAALLAITWMTNLFNFMDGADALAGGMAAVGFAAYALAAHAAGADDLAGACVALCAASAGFLCFNFPPAKVFMGDAGSVPLGFLAGGLGWLGLARGLWPAWFPLLVFAPFIVDATVTLARRVLAREPFLRAHRTHYYQRLVLGGWSHGRLALLEWALMCATACSALLALAQHAAVQRAILAGWIVAFGVLLVAIDRHHPRKPSPPGPTPGQTPGTRR